MQRQGSVDPQLDSKYLDHIYAPQTPSLWPLRVVHEAGSIQMQAYLCLVCAVGWALEIVRSVLPSIEVENHFMESRTETESRIATR